jgi:hypothetical protein
MGAGRIECVGLCGFLYETAINHGKILVGAAQRYKELIDVKEYASIREQCKETSESASSLVRSYLSAYPDQRKLFKATKDPKTKDGSA